MTRKQQSIAYYNTAIQNSLEGNDTLALINYNKAIKLNPDFFQAHFNLGKIHIKKKKHTLALKHLKKAHSLNPENILILSVLAETFLTLDQLDKGINLLEVGTQIQNAPKSIFINLFIALINKGDFDSALKTLNESELKNTDSLHFYSLIVMYLPLRQYNSLVIKAINEITGYIFNHSKDLESTYLRLDKYSHGGKLFIELTKYKSQYSQDIGRILIKLLIRSLESNINLSLKHDSLGLLFKENSEFIISKYHFKTALTYDSKNKKLLSHFVDILYYLNEINEANSFLENHFLNTEDSLPHYIIPYYLHKQNFKMGWLYYNLQPILNQPLEDENIVLSNELPPPSEEVLVIADQGIGDAIMFSSCLDDFAKTHSGVIHLACDERLITIFKDSFPFVKTYLPISEIKSQEYRYKNYIRLSQLPSWYRDDIVKFPMKSYLNANEQLIKQWKEKLKPFNSNLKIGFAWKGGSKHLSAKSIPLNEFRPLFSLPKISFFSLQYGDYHEELNEIKSEFNNVYEMKSLDTTNDINNQAAFIKTLDAVVQISNASAHLSGALGVPTFILSKANMDFRWFQGRLAGQSAWYKKTFIITGDKENSIESLMFNAKEALVTFLRDQNTTKCT